eukprot:CFRG6740T1
MTMEHISLIAKNSKTLAMEELKIELSSTTTYKNTHNWVDNSRSGARLVECNVNQQYNLQTQTSTSHLLFGKLNGIRGHTTSCLRRRYRKYEPQPYGVYEGIGVVGGKAFDHIGHLKRLERSVNELRIPFTKSQIDALPDIWNELIKKNTFEEGLLYLQVTRGASSDRTYIFPSLDTPATVVMFLQPVNILNSEVAARGQSVITFPDTRWARRDIKTIQLLTQSLGKNAAKSILPGITRSFVLRLAKQSGLQIEERPFSRTEAYNATEAFVTSSTTLVHPVVVIDSHIIGNGKPGPITEQLRKQYIDAALENAKSG